MATIAAGLKLMRSICLSLPDTSEGTHYGKASFKVRRKIFATYGEERIGHGMIVGLEPEHARLIVAGDPRFAPFREYPNCVFMAAAQMNDPAEVRELVVESYGIVAGSTKSKTKPTKKKPVAASKKKALKKPAEKKRAKKKPS